MGSDNSKLAYRNVIVQLTTKTQPVDANDDEFWNTFWSKSSITVQDMFVLIPAAEIRALREESPNNLATLSYKAVERLSQIAEASFPTARDQQTALTCIRLLTRILPYIFEDPEWRHFFWSALPTETDSATDDDCVPLAQSLLTALCDLLFCPDFTVHSVSKRGPESPEDMHSIDSCEYIWQAGVGFAQTQTHNATHDTTRTEILRLLLTCFSEIMYLERDEAECVENQWVAFFTSSQNRHALPLFASLLNVVCAYDPVGLGVPYNHLVLSDSREPLVEVALQVLCVVLEKEINSEVHGYRNCSYRTSVTSRSGSEVEEMTSARATLTPNRTGGSAGGIADTNLFVNYMSRIHRDEDFAFILAGLTRLLNNPLQQTYLPGSTKKVQLHQELLVLFWRMCEINKKFMYYVLKSSQVLDLMVPILYHLNDARSDPARLGVIHVGVFILLLLSGERNFGVRLNKPYKHRVSLDVTMFTGTHADLLIIVFHRLITCGHKRLQPLFDCLLTIMVNVSPYLKSLSMVTANKLLHLLEVFSQPWYLYSGRTHYQLVFLLLEAFNNIIQYQFDGNSNLVYTLIRKRQVFYRLATLPTEQESIQAILDKRSGVNVTPAITSSDSSPVHISDQSRSSHNSVCSAVSVGSRYSGSEDRPTEGQLSKTVGMNVCQPTDSTNPTNDNPVAQNGDRLPSASVMHASLPKTPELSRMTDRQLTNTKAGLQDTRSMEDALVSHSSPSRRFRSLSDTTTSSNLHEHLNSDTDTLYSVPLMQHGCEEDSRVREQSRITDARRLNDTDKCERYHQLVQPKSSEATTLPNSCVRGHAVSRNRTSIPSDRNWVPTSEWVIGWKSKMPFQTIMRLLQVLVPQVEKICIDKGLTDESEIVKFLQNGTLVGLLPVPHPILIRKYQSNAGTAVWFRNYLWGVIYLRNIDPPIWYDTNVRLFEVQRA